MMYGEESNLIMENHIQYAGAIARVGSSSPAEGKMYGKEEIK
jgi:hypothetical protein